MNTKRYNTGAPFNIFLFAAFFIITLIINSCTFGHQSKYQNREEDKKAAEAVAERLYGYLNAKEYKRTFGLYSDTLWSITTKENVLRFYIKMDSILGKRVNRELTNWETERVESKNSYGNYHLTYQVKYEHGAGKEKIRLVQNENGPLKIVAFKVDSPDLLK